MPDVSLFLIATRLREAVTGTQPLDLLPALAAAYALVARDVYRRRVDAEQYLQSVACPEPEGCAEPERAERFARALLHVQEAWDDLDRTARLDPQARAERDRAILAALQRRMSAAELAGEPPPAESAGAGDSDERDERDDPAVLEEELPPGDGTGEAPPSS